MSKKFRSNTDSAEQIELYKKNKYFKTILIAYYAYSRNMNVIEVYELLQNDPDLYTEIFDEYIRYCADENVVIGSNQNANSFTPQAPTSKSSQIISLLKYASNNAFAENK